MYEDFNYFDGFHDSTEYNVKRIAELEKVCNDFGLHYAFNFNSIDRVWLVDIYKRKAHLEYFQSEELYFAINKAIEWLDEEYDE